MTALALHKCNPPRAIRMPPCRPHTSAYMIGISEECRHPPKRAPDGFASCPRTSRPRPARHGCAEPFVAGPPIRSDSASSGGSFRGICGPPPSHHWRTTGLTQTGPLVPIWTMPPGRQVASSLAHDVPSLAHRATDLTGGATGLGCSQTRFWQFPGPADLRVSSGSCVFSRSYCGVTLETPRAVVATPARPSSA